MRTLLRRTWKVLRATVIVFVLSAYVIPDVTATLTGASCASWQRRDVVLDTMVTDSIVDAARDTSEVQVPFLPGGAGGLALPGIVAFDGEPEASLWVHEMAHQVQMDREGLLRFAATYTYDWFQGRYHGCGPGDAYRTVRYELEAQAAGRHIDDVMREAFTEGRGAMVLALEAVPGEDLVNVPTRSHNVATWMAALLCELHGYRPNPAEVRDCKVEN